MRYCEQRYTIFRYLKRHYQAKKLELYLQSFQKVKFKPDGMISSDIIVIKKVSNMFEGRNKKLAIY